MDRDLGKDLGFSTPEVQKRAQKQAFDPGEIGRIGKRESQAEGGEEFDALLHEEVSREDLPPLQQPFLESQEELLSFVHGSFLPSPFPSTQELLHQTEIGEVEKPRKRRAVFPVLLEEMAPGKHSFVLPEEVQERKRKKIKLSWEMRDEAGFVDPYLLKILKERGLSDPVGGLYDPRPWGREPFDEKVWHKEVSFGVTSYFWAAEEDPAGNRQGCRLLKDGVAIETVGNFTFHRLRYQGGFLEVERGKLAQDLNP